MKLVAPAFRAQLRQVASAVAPSLLANRAVRYQRSLRDELGITAHAERFVARNGDRVARGPLAGLRYWPSGDAPISKLLGCYEREIQPWIYQCLRERPTRFFDLGAGDGYYAVGLARFGIPVNAFEVSVDARRAIKQLATLNQVEVHVHGKATSRRLRRLPLDGALVLSDCEGNEAKIFDPPTISALSHSLVIVELHEARHPGITKELVGRFSESHHSETVAPEPRDPAEYPELAVMPPKQAQLCLSEMRTDKDLRWAFFMPRT